METQVNTIAIPALSVKVGYKSKKGNTSNCKKVANKNPLPTSIQLSIKLLICLHLFFYSFSNSTSTFISLGNSITLSSLILRSVCISLSNSESTIIDLRDGASVHISLNLQPP